jgi:sulfate/thiosulfate transport system permease protein
VQSQATAPGRAVAARAGRNFKLGKWSLRGAAIVYLLGAIALPLSAVASQGFGDGLAHLRAAMTTQGAWEAIRLTLSLATLCALINGVFGTLLAYVLVRYQFFGRGVLSAIVDVPLAIPTLVTGVMLLALYGPASPVGSALEGVGIKVAFAPLGILLALLFVTLPFVVRTVQPVLTELDLAEEEAAQSLGASGWTTFRNIVLPALRPGIAAGMLLAFARALGEFGSVAVIAGNISGKTLTAPFFIFQLNNQFRVEEAAAVATALFLTSFTVVLLTERLLGRNKRIAP